jgi:DNA repair exonuclease SbcCD nuclease subunit
MAVKILHTADWQLGKAFAKLPDEAAVPLREQRISTIKKIAALSTQHAVDAVLVAGDVFEFETVAERTLHQTVHAMAGYSGPWLLLPGNHDPATEEGVWSQLRRLETLPKNVVILDKPQAYSLANKNAVVLAAPLRRKHEAVDVTEWFDSYDTTPDTIRIGLTHGSMDNRLPERGEAPNTISDKRAQKAHLDYLALGDWHGTLKVAPNTWYSGTHETDRFRDNDSGNVLLVTLKEHGQEPVVEPISVGHYRWRQLDMSISIDLGAEEIASALQGLGDPPENLVVQLAPRGIATFETNARIEKVLAKWSSLVRYLEYKDQMLVSQPSNDDLDELGRTGFIGEAVKQLRLMAQDATNSERDIAEAALQLLYAESMRVVNKP